MNDLTFRAAVVLFPASPRLLLGMSFVGPPWMPWLLLPPPPAMLVGWPAIAVAVFLHFEAIGDALRFRGDTPPPPLLEAWAADGGKRVFALFFGWLYALVYLVPWLLMDAAANSLRHCINAVRFRGALPSPTTDTWHRAREG